MMETTVTLDIGARLKAQREKLGYTLDAAAGHTRIRKSHLINLEENQFSALPGRVYVVGFVRVYAQYLGLDSNELLLHLEPVATDAKTHFHAPISRSASPRKDDKRGGWGAFAGGFLIVLLLGAAIYSYVPVFRAKAPDKSPLPAVVAEQVKPPEQALPPPSVLVEPEPEPELKGEAAPTELAPVLEEKLPEARALPQIGDKGSSLRMLALSESSLIIHLDGRKPHQYKLYDGLDLTWQVKSVVSIELGEKGSARFWLDGREIELDGTTSFQLQQNAGE